MIGNLVALIVFSITANNANIHSFLKRFYSARIMGDSVFISSVISDTLHIEYPLIEGGDFKYTGFIIKSVEKVDSLMWKVSAEIIEGFKRWRNIGTVKEFVKVMNVNKKWRIVSIAQSYKNAFISKKDIKNAKDVYIVNDKDLVLLENPSLVDGIKLNVYEISSSSSYQDTCPPVDVIPDFFPPVNTNSAGKVVSFKHNMFQFCFIQGGEEGAAGHIYTYYYFIPVNFKNVVFAYVVENTNCDNYDEKYRRDCEEENFKRNKVPFKTIELLRKIR